jgi:adenylate cyclase
MNLEIERKFLIKNTEFKKACFKKRHIIQGFLNSNKNRVVRVRIIDNSAFLTIKGISDNSGTTRFEWEKEIALEDAKDLMILCEKDIIEKNRYYHTLGKHIIEIDEFLGKNKGLLIAEIELKNKNESFLKPDYLGVEVTNEEKYYNSSLSKNPFKNWS